MKDTKDRSGEFKSVKEATIEVTTAWLADTERNPLVCQRCQVCALRISEKRAGMVVAYCGCCDIEWLLDVVP